LLQISSLITSARLWPVTREITSPKTAVLVLVCAASHRLRARLRVARNPSRSPRRTASGRCVRGAAASQDRFILKLFVGGIAVGHRYSFLLLPSPNACQRHHVAAPLPAATFQFRK
jgi:hypothetical protein